MTKRKPDQVNELRISLQDKLSSQVDSLVGAQSLNDVASAIDKLSSFENLYIIATVIEIVTGEEILPGTPNDVYELIDSFRDWWKGTSVESGILMQIVEAFTNITPGPFDDIILGGIQAGGLTPGFNPGWTDPGLDP